MVQLFVPGLQEDVPVCLQLQDSGPEPAPAFGVHSVQCPGRLKSWQLLRIASHITIGVIRNISLAL